MSDCDENLANKTIRVLENAINEELKEVPTLELLVGMGFLASSILGGSLPKEKEEDANRAIEAFINGVRSGAWMAYKESK